MNSVWNKLVDLKKIDDKFIKCDREIRQITIFPLEEYDSKKRNLQIKAYVFWKKNKTPKKENIIIRGCELPLLKMNHIYLISGWFNENHFNKNIKFNMEKIVKIIYKGEKKWKQQKR